MFCVLLYFMFILLPLEKQSVKVEGIILIRFIIKLQIFFAAVASKNVWLLISFIFLLVLLIYFSYVRLLMFFCILEWLFWMLSITWHTMQKIFKKLCVYISVFCFFHTPNYITLHIINLYKAYLIAHFYYSCHKLSIKFVIPVTVFYVKFLIRWPPKRN